jgi:hypothetical protein
MKPEQRAALVARLQQQDVAALGEQQAADALNAPGSGAGATWRKVASLDVVRKLSIDAAPNAPTLAAWGLIELNAARAPSTAVSTMATPNAADIVLGHIRMLVSWVTRLPEIDATDADVRARFGAAFSALRVAGFISQSTYDDLVAMVSRPATWWESAGLAEPVTARDIGLARAGGG